MSGYESITANGTTIAGTAACDANYEFHNIITCTSTNYVVRLPNDVVNRVHKIKNTGAYPAQLLPYNASSSVDGLAVGTGFWLAGNGGEVSIVITSYVSASTPVINYQSFSKTGLPVVDIAAAYTVLAQDSGAIFALSAAGAYTIALPSPTTRGLDFSFVVTGATIGQIITLNCGAGLLNGNIPQRNTAGTGLVAGAVTNGTAVQNVLINAAAVKGTTIHLQSDGTNWVATGVNVKNLDTTLAVDFS